MFSIYKKIIYQLDFYSGTPTENPITLINEIQISHDPIDAALKFTKFKYSECDKLKRKRLYVCVIHTAQAYYPIEVYRICEMNDYLSDSDKTIEWLNKKTRIMNKPKKESEIEKKKKERAYKSWWNKYFSFRSSHVVHLQPDKQDRHVK